MMNAGMPGTGIGGLFYIAGALWMPLHGMWRRAVGAEDAPGWRRIGTLWGIAAGILAALWATGWGIGFLVTVSAPTATVTQVGALAPAAAVNVIRWATVLGSLAILVAVLTTVQLLRLVVAREVPPAALATAAANPDAPAAGAPISLALATGLEREVA